MRSLCQLSLALVVLIPSCALVVPVIGVVTGQAPATATAPSASPDQTDDFNYPGVPDVDSRRAFFSAPPVIPHAIGNSDRECLGCHLQGRAFLGHQARRTSHPQFKNCQQCHVKAGAPDYLGETVVPVETAWQGLTGPGVATRPHPYAPPVIPHRLFMRDNCQACHHPDAHKAPALSREHHVRANCFQCHVLMDQSLLF